MKIALLQMTSGIDPARNADAIDRAIVAAAASGAKILFTPEMSGLVDRNRERAAASIATEEADVVLAAATRAAARERLWVQLGSLAIRRPDGRLANRSFVIDAAGGIRARYDKLHLFDVDLPSGESWRESAAYVAGDQAVTVETPIGPMGLSICYDLRFASLYAVLSSAGATVLTVPSAFTRPTGRAHWHVLLRSRAIESAAFVIAAAQTGHHEDGRETFGHSLVVDPWGDVILDMGQEAGLGFADLDLARAGDVRSRIPVIAHRRQIPPVSVVP